MTPSELKNLVKAEEVAANGNGEEKPAVQAEASQVETKVEQEFRAELITFRLHRGNVQIAAVKCAILAITNFISHGSTNLCEDFNNALVESKASKHWQRPYLSWLIAYAPITMRKGKMVKDIGPNAVVANLKGALERDFFTFEVPKEIKTFNLDDPATAALAAIKKFTNPEKYKPASGVDATTASGRISRLETAIRQAA